MKHIPERTCVVCRKKAEKSNFIRLVLQKSGEILIEKDKPLEGRGAYICKNQECIKKCRKCKALSRVFKKNVSDEIYSELESYGTDES